MTNSKPVHPKPRDVVTDDDLAAIVARIEAGASYAAAAAAVGVRPSALRRRKKTDPATAQRLRAAWREQTRRLLSAPRGGIA